MVSFSFNGKKNDRIYMLAGRTKAPFAPLVREFVKYGSRYHLKKTETELLDIIQPIGYKAKTYEEALEIKNSLAPWLVTEDLVPLIFDDEPGLIYWSVVEGTLEDLQRVERSILWEGTIKFKCSLVTGQNRTLSIGTSFTNHNVISQKKSFWTSRTVFNTNASRYVIENNVGGKIIINFNFVPTDILEIDAEKRKITINGNLQMPSIDLMSDWFVLEPGTNRLKASHTTTVSYVQTYQ
ncbi:distal tail protein Dit [Alkalihalobacillus sp. NPDC078783]